jgi:hypothetical protein
VVVSVGEIFSLVVATAVVSIALLAAILPWAREPAKLLPFVGAALAGILVWNLLLNLTHLNLTHATALNVDGMLGLSVQDLGSGIAALAFVAAVGAIRGGRAREVAVAACVIGLVTVVIDRFV